MLALDRDFLHDYLRIFREEAAAHDLESKPDLNAALRIPGMFTAAENAGPPEGVEGALDVALAEALDELNEFRSREGREIADELRGHNQRLNTAAEHMEQLRTAASEYFQKRLAERLQEVAKGIQIDPQRLAQEAAILADRSDIGEELARLKDPLRATGGAARCGRRGRQEAGLSATRDESGNQHYSFEDQRRGRAGHEDHGPGPGRQSRHRKDTRAISQS